MSFWETFPRCLASLRFDSPVQPSWEPPTHHDGLNSWSPQKRAKERYGRVIDGRGVWGHILSCIWTLRGTGCLKIALFDCWIPVLTVSRYNRGLILLFSEAGLRHPWCQSWLELNFVVWLWEVWAWGCGCLVREMPPWKAHVNCWAGGNGTCGTQHLHLCCFLKLLLLLLFSC